MLERFTISDLNNYCISRSGEDRLGSQLTLPQSERDTTELLAAHKAAGGQFVLLGIAECIGPLANMGNPGAELGWHAFLQRFLNLQHNNHLNASRILLLGQMACSDLQQRAAGCVVNEHGSRTQVAGDIHQPRNVFLTQSAAAHLVAVYSSASAQ